MSHIVRQSELFAGNDWTVIYQAFSQINFNAYDFNTIRDSMKSYIETNYPEEFNDWINSSEFVSLLDLIAYLGQSLAFRMDLNTRENFIDIARREESVLRLARFLSYNPRRNRAASGLAKIVSIKTSNNITDSFGTNLAGKVINWNDSSNSNWKDQWFNILKDVLIDTNGFGLPLQETDINGVPTQLYRLKNTPVNSGSFPFSASINGSSLPFEVVNMSFDMNNGRFIEMDPDLTASLQFCYRNDSNGNDSKDTGFFVMFKQGSMRKQDYSIDNPVSNLTITLPDSNINDSDVWVQTVNDAGYKTPDGTWSKVGYVPTDDMSKVIYTNDNITYNSYDPGVRNIFQAVTQANNKVMLRFGDGQFATAPSGNLRAWYRVSENATYSIKPENIRNIPISFVYLNSTGSQQTLTITISLQETMDNGSENETVDEIRRRAPNVYNTQGRMVSGSDYNALPSTNSVALKVKAVNRIYSGQSRYLDLNDPTGSYQATNVFGDDGYLYTETYSGYQEIATDLNYTPTNLISNFLQPMVQKSYVRDMIYNDWLTNPNYNFKVGWLYWNQSTTANFSSTGYFSYNQDGSNAAELGPNASQGSIQSYFIPNSLVKFQLPSGEVIWATIASVDPLGSTHMSYVSTDSNKVIGPITLNQSIPTGSQVISVLPCFRTTFNNSEFAQISFAFSAKKTFGIGFDYQSQDWYVIDGDKISNGNYDYTTRNSNTDSSWISKIEYSSLYWRITTRGKIYVFESMQEVKFFFNETYKTIDPQSGRLGSDEVKILKYNFASGSNGSSLDSNGVYHPTVTKKDIPFSISESYSYKDGSLEPKRVVITFSDSTYDGKPDNPESFIQVMDMTVPDKNNPADVLVFHRRTTDANGYEVWVVDNNVTIMNHAPTNPTSTVYVPGSSFDNGTFYTPSDDSPENHVVNIGTRNLSFQWRHFAPSDHRIDPSVTNIIDIFVLMKAYYNDMTAWLNAGLDPLNIPEVPSVADIQSAYSDLEDYKMFSDEIVWRPVKFKIIGGKNASPELKFSLKVVKLPDTSVSDGEIKTKIIQSIRYYFDIERWDFGETFYASELMAFIHQQLIDGVGSVVLVPQSGDQAFGDLFQITSLPDELFFCTLQVSDIQIIPSITPSTLRIT